MPGCSSGVAEWGRGPAKEQGERAGVAPGKTALKLNESEARVVWGADEEAPRVFCFLVCCVEILQYSDGRMGLLSRHCKRELPVLFAEHLRRRWRAAHLSTVAAVPAAARLPLLHSYVARLSCSFHIPFRRMLA